MYQLLKQNSLFLFKFISHHKVSIDIDFDDKKPIPGGYSSSSDHKVMYLYLKEIKTILHNTSKYDHKTKLKINYAICMSNE